MTQTSYPWPGTTLTDAGPYSAEQWNSMWGAGVRSGVKLGRPADYGIGVFYAISAQLDPSLAGTDLDVDTGAAIVDGLYFENDASVSIDVGSASAKPAANPRIDYIVVRKNYSTTVAYSPTAGPSVAPQTARLTVIRGTEAAAPVAPSLTQDTNRLTYWDIPIATVQVDTSGNLTNLVDAREFVDAETKTVFVPASGGYNITDGAMLSTSSSRGWAMLDNKISYGVGWFQVPVDYIGNMIVTVLLRSAATGNVYASNTAAYGACTESYQNHTDQVVATATSVTIGLNSCVQPISMTVPTAEDFVLLNFNRSATDPLDTVNNIVYIPGWQVQYLGWKK